MPMVEGILVHNAWIKTEGLSPKVQGFCTTRHHGVSVKPFDSLNLGDHVGDNPADVQTNRQRLAQWLPSAPVWVRQVHGQTVLVVDDIADIDDVDKAQTGQAHQADALVTTRAGKVLGILTADCMAVVMANDAGTVLGVAHAGWRGLVGGVLDSTLAAMRNQMPRLGAWRAWIGPCIGPAAFEVGDDVRTAFVQRDQALARHFAPGVAPHKWWCDMPAIAQKELSALGAESVKWCGLCTVNDTDRRFFSYRRDGRTGRMATVAWLLS